MLFNLFGFEFQAFDLRAKRLDDRARNKIDSRFQSAPQSAQRLNNRLAPLRNRRVESRDLISAELPFSFRKKQHKQQQIHVCARFVLERKTGIGHAGPAVTALVATPTARGVGV